MNASYLLISGLVGATAPIILNCIFTIIREYKERSALKDSLIQEIKGIVQIIKKRKYLNYLQKEYEAMCQSGMENCEDPITVNIPNHYSLIYNTNAKNISKVDPKYAKNIVCFHQLLEAVIQDVKPDGTFSIGYSRKGLKEAIVILEEVLDIGENL